MPNSKSCRLCLNVCDEYKNLYDNYGVPSRQVYGIALKYFDSMFLTASEDICNNPVMCLICWRVISEFDHFQETIISKQNNLLKIEIAKNENDYTINDQKVEIKQETISSSNPVVEEIPLEWKNSLISSDRIVKADSNSDLNNEAMFAETSVFLNNLPSSSSIIKEEPLEILPSDYDTEENYSTENEDDDSDYKPKNKQVSQITTNNSELCLEDSNAGCEANVDLIQPNCGFDVSKYHDIISQWRTTLNCPLCDEACTNFNLIRQHFKETHPLEKVCYIQCCNVKFSKLSLIAEHALVHMNPESFKCKSCEHTFKHKRTLQKHMRLKHCNKAPATSCKFKARSPKELDDIIARWKTNIECGICLKPYDCFLLLQRHFRQEHPNEAAHILCCKTKLDSRLKVSDHASLHMTPDAFRCEVCGKCFFSSVKLLRHKRNAHAIAADGSKLANYRCEFCEKVFSQLSFLKDHLPLHTGKDMYKCGFCSETFRFKTKFYRHQRQVHLHEEEPTKTKKKAKLTK